jgi:hypothetical protein
MSSAARKWTVAVTRTSGASARHLVSRVDGPADGRCQRNCHGGAGTTAEAVVRPVEQQAADEQGFPLVLHRPFDQELERMRGEVGGENSMGSPTCRKARL